MAPLFEVTELDEASPGREDLTAGGKRHASQNSRAVPGKQSKKIEVTVPAEFQQNEIKESGDSEGEMISQMTIMHVIPKGRKKGEKGSRELHRVQETFLNVDIPAEDVSSVRAEHGSSHQEDISSNATAVKSHTTGSEVSLNTKPQKDIPGSEDDVEEKEEGNKSEAPLKVEQDKEKVSARDKNQSEIPLDSYRETLDMSNESLEMLCDSARFISHEQVSPVEGESDGIELESSRRFVLGGLEGNDDEENDDRNQERKESLLGNLTRRIDKDSARTNTDFEENQDGRSDYNDGEAGSGVTKEDKQLEEEQPSAPPGVFFFQGSTPSETSSDKALGLQETGPDASQGVARGNETNEDFSAVNDQSKTVTEIEVKNTNVTSDEEVSGELESEQAENKILAQEMSTQAIEAAVDQNKVGDFSAKENNPGKGDTDMDYGTEPKQDLTNSQNVTEASLNGKSEKEFSELAKTPETKAAEDPNEAENRIKSNIVDNEAEQIITGESSHESTLPPGDLDKSVNPETQGEYPAALTNQVSVEGTGSNDFQDARVGEGNELNNNQRQNDDGMRSDFGNQDGIDIKTEDENKNTAEGNLIAKDEQSFRTVGQTRDEDNEQDESGATDTVELRQEPEGSSED